MAQFKGWRSSTAGAELLSFLYCDRPRDWGTPLGWRWFQYCAKVYKFIIIVFYHFPVTTKAPLKDEEWLGHCFGLKPKPKRHLNQEHWGYCWPYRSSINSDYQ